MDNMVIWPTLFFVGLVAGWLLFGRLDRELARKLKDEADEARRQADAHIVQVKGQNEQLRKDVDRLEVQLREESQLQDVADEDLKDHREQIASLEKRLAERNQALEEQHQRTQQLARELAENEKLLEDLDQGQDVHREELEQLRRLQREHDVNVTRLQNRIDQLEPLAARLQEREHELRSLRKDHDQDRKEQDSLIERLQAEVEEQRLAHTSQDAVPDQLPRRIADLERELAEAQSERGERDAEEERRQRELDEKDEQIARFREKLSTLLSERAARQEEDSLDAEDEPEEDEFADEDEEVEGTEAARPETLASDDGDEEEEEEEDGQLELSLDDEVESSGENLELLAGVGPAIAKRLNQLGFQTVRQIADLSTKDFTRISDELAPFRNRDKRDLLLKSARDLVKSTKKKK